MNTQLKCLTCIVSSHYRECSRSMTETRVVIWVPTSWDPLSTLAVGGENGKLILSITCIENLIFFFRINNFTQSIKIYLSQAIVVLFTVDTYIEPLLYATMYDCQTWRFWSFTDFVLSPDLGFRLSNRTFSALVMRYSSKDGNVEFGDFILCAIRMKTMLGKGNNSVISHTFGWRGMLYLQWMDFQIVFVIGK